MLKKRLVSAATAICMGVTMLASVVVNAAEKSYAPWSVYFAPKNEHVDFTKWIKPDIQFSNGVVYVSKTVGNGNQDLCLTNYENGNTLLRVSSDAQGYTAADGTMYGAVAVGFEVPVAGDYKVDFDSVSIGGLNYTNAAYAKLGVLDVETNQITEIRTDGLHGNKIADDPDKKTEYSQTVSLDAGEKIIIKYYSSNDGFLRQFFVNYKITDLTTGKVYDYDNFTKEVIIPEKPETNNVYELGDYYKSQTVDNSMWSINLATDAQAATWNDMSTWVSYPIEEYRNADTKAIVIQKGTTNLTVYDMRPDGWFGWRPAGDGESQGTGTVILGWTAPEAGTYVFDFGIFNMGSDVKGDDTYHKFAYLKNGESTPVEIESFNMPGASKGIEGNKQLMLDVEAGETIYLLCDANVDGWGDNAVIRYEITDINNPSNTWSASDMGKTHELTDSPYSFWTSYHNWGTYTSNLLEYRSTELSYQSDNLQSITNSWKVPFFLINKNGNFVSTPSGTSGYNNAVMFDVPKDGYYKVEFSGKNINMAAGAPANCFGILYKISGRDTTIGTALSNSGGLLQNTYSYFANTVSAVEGDKLLLNVNTNSDAFLNQVGGKYRITRLEKFNYGLLQNNLYISNMSELKAGETLTATVDYLDDAAETMQVVVAFFDANGVMKAFGLSDSVTTTAGTPSTISATVTVPEITEGMYVKTMVVDSLNTLVPLDTPSILK